jgi:predicted HicB family RNase H-like nuclease
MAYSESSYKASQKYKAAHIKRIPFEVQIEYHERIKQAAAQAGVSVNTYIKQAIEMRMEAGTQKKESPE